MLIEYSYVLNKCFLGAFSGLQVVVFLTSWPECDIDLRFYLRLFLVLPAVRHVAALPGKETHQSRAWDALRGKPLQTL